MFLLKVFGRTMFICYAVVGEKKEGRLFYLECTEENPVPLIYMVVIVCACNQALLFN